MAATYNFKPIKKGDTFHDRKIKITDNLAAPIDLTGWTVNLNLMTGNKVIRKLPITLDNAVNGEIILNMWDVDMKVYSYDYELIMTNPTGYTLTYMVGKFPVIN